MWRTRVLQSCSTSALENYQGAVHRFWQARFAALADGDVVVDIGTGNGAVALLAVQHAFSRGIRLQVHGVDRADVDPLRLPAWQALPHDAVHFHPKVACEQLPLADSSVTLLSSQYAFEYMDGDAMRAEVLRVLAPGGCAALVMHSSDSVVSATLQQQLRAYERVLGDGGIFELCMAAIDRGDVPPAQDTPIGREVQALIALGAELPLADVLRQALRCVRDGLLRAEHEPGPARATLNENLVALRAQWQRQVDLQRAISTPAQLQALAQRFEASGCTTELAPLDEVDGQRLGWTLLVRPLPVDA